MSGTAGGRCCATAIETEIAANVANRQRTNQPFVSDFILAPDFHAVESKQQHNLLRRVEHGERLNAPGQLHEGGKGKAREGT
jgi:hypothetical protein